MQPNNIIVRAIIPITPCSDGSPHGPLRHRHQALSLYRTSLHKSRLFRALASSSTRHASRVLATRVMDRRSSGTWLELDGKTVTIRLCLHLVPHMKMIARPGYNLGLAASHPVNSLIHRSPVPTEAIIVLLQLLPRLRRGRGASWAKTTRVYGNYLRHCMGQLWVLTWSLVFLQAQSLAVVPIVSLALEIDH